LYEKEKFFKFHCVCVCVFVCVCVCVCVCVFNVFSTGLRGGGGWVGGWVGGGGNDPWLCTDDLFLGGRLHREREKRKTEREREKLHYITCGPTTQREEIFF
jgi:hypothetical protein